MVGRRGHLPWWAGGILPWVYMLPVYPWVYMPPLYTPGCTTILMRQTAGYTVHHGRNRGPARCPGLKKVSNLP